VANFTISPLTRRDGPEDDYFGKTTTASEDSAVKHQQHQQKQSRRSAPATPKSMSSVALDSLDYLPRSKSSIFSSSVNAPDNEWMYHTGVRVNENCGEETGTTWLVSRASSTQLDDFQKGGDGEEDKDNRLPYGTELHQDAELFNNDDDADEQIMQPNRFIMGIGSWVDRLLGLPTEEFEFEREQAEQQRRMTVQGALLVTSKGDDDGEEAERLDKIKRRDEQEESSVDSWVFTLATRGLRAIGLV